MRELTMCENFRPDWVSYFLAICQVVAQRSLDPDTKHGAVIVDSNHSILATGYNGPPRNCHDDQIPLERPEKYLWFVHAEEAAIDNAARCGVSLDGATLYVNGFPCARCMRSIINAGIRVVRYLESYSHMLDDKEIETVKTMVSMSGVSLENAEIAYPVLKNARDDYFGRFRSSGSYLDDV